MSSVRDWEYLSLETLWHWMMSHVRATCSPFPRIHDFREFMYFGQNNLLYGLPPSRTWGLLQSCCYFQNICLVILNQIIWQALQSSSYQKLHNLLIVCPFCLYTSRGGFTVLVLGRHSWGLARGEGGSWGRHQNTLVGHEAEVGIRFTASDWNFPVHLKSVIAPVDGGIQSFS